MLFRFPAYARPPDVIIVSGDDIMKKKHFLKEVVALGATLFVLASLARQGNRLIDTAFNRVAFPANSSIFESFKAYFTAVTALVLIEYVVAFEYPNNYLLSRVVSSLVMMAITAFIFALYYLIGYRTFTAVFWHAVCLVSIIGGQYVAYRIQRRKELRFSLHLGLAQYLVTASLIIVFTQLSPSGFLFTWFR